MKCQTIQPGAECTFWSKAGCTFEGNACHPVIEECQGCDRIVDSSIGPVCTAYPAPEKKWSAGLCNFATHRKIEIKVSDVKVNPLKASKRGGKR